MWFSLQEAIARAKVVPTMLPKKHPADGLIADGGVIATGLCTVLMAADE